MSDRSRLRSVWNRVHQDKSSPEKPDDRVISFAEYLRSKLPPRAAVLDAGCGRGRNILCLSEKGFIVCGCDLSPVALHKARVRALKVGKPADFQVADIRLLPYTDNLFDAVVCSRVLPYHYISDIFEAVGELRRVLRPGGYLYLDLLHREDAEYGCGLELEEHTFLDPDGVPIHFSSRQEVAALLEGFEVQRLSRIEIGQRPRVAYVVRARKGL